MRALNHKKRKGEAKTQKQKTERETESETITMFEQRSSSDAFAALSIKTKTTRDNKRYTRGSDVNNCSPAPTRRFLSLSHSLFHGGSGKRQLLRRRASLKGNTMTVTATATAATTTTLTSTQANKKNTQRMINFQLQFSHVPCHISEAPNSALGPPTRP